MSKTSHVKRGADSRHRQARPLREAGKTYVMFREGDPWHACLVTWMAHTRPFKIGGHVYVDCYLPKRWRKIATAKKSETRPVRLSELW
ncbi:MAG: hypothetical protein IH623_21900 [Verrucomicrobia bacterium]|nr:hypothetical protein [Verrucomicrobiota bacterium]